MSIGDALYVARDGSAWVIACEVGSALDLAIAECAVPGDSCTTGAGGGRWCYASGETVKRIKASGREVRTIGEVSMADMIERWRVGDAMAKKTGSLFT